MLMKLSVTPVSKPRMTRSDVWKKRPAVMKYREFCDNLRAEWGTARVRSQLSVDFYLPMPRSWSLKKQMEMQGKPHQQKPDIDNLLKAFLDALCPDDAYVYDVKTRKFWSTEGFIEVNES